MAAKLHYKTTNIPTARDQLPNICHLPGPPTLTKKEIKFSSYIYKEIQNGAVAKSYMTNGLLIYGEIFARFHMTLQLLHSEFPYIWGKLYFRFLSVYFIISPYLYIQKIKHVYNWMLQDRSKPGRQVVTFLLICNLAIWVIYTFEVQKVEESPVQVQRRHSLTSLEAIKSSGHRFCPEFSRLSPLTP